MMLEQAEGQDKPLIMQLDALEMSALAKMSKEGKIAMFEQALVELDQKLAE